MALSRKRSQRGECTVQCTYCISREGMDRSRSAWQREGGYRIDNWISMRWKEEKGGKSLLGSCKRNGEKKQYTADISAAREGKKVVQHQREHHAHFRMVLSPLGGHTHRVRMREMGAVFLGPPHQAFVQGSPCCHRVAQKRLSLLLSSSMGREVLTEGGEYETDAEGGGETPSYEWVHPSHTKIGRTIGLERQVGHSSDGDK